MAGRGLALLRRSDRRRPGRHLKALTEAVELCEGRVSDDVLAEARRVVEQADRRLALSGSATVVALAGATGSGKSSLFNALTGTDLATVGVRRPPRRTRWPPPGGEDAAADLLDWLKIPRRHAGAGPSRDGHAGRAGAAGPAGPRLDRAGPPDGGRSAGGAGRHADLGGRPAEVRRRGAARPLPDPAGKHADVMMIVLNQADRLTPAERERCLADLRRLLDPKACAGSTCSRSRPSPGGVGGAAGAAGSADRRTRRPRRAGWRPMSRAPGGCVPPAARRSTSSAARRSSIADQSDRRGGRGAGGDRGGRPGLATARRAGHRLARCCPGWRSSSLTRYAGCTWTAWEPAVSGRRSTRPRWGVPRCRPPRECRRRGSTPRCGRWPTRPPPA